MKFEIFIARRYLQSRNKPFFVALLLWITLFAVSSGVLALIFVSSVMNGFERDIQTRVLGFKAPMHIFHSPDTPWPERFTEWKEKKRRVSGIFPFVEGEAVLRSESGAILGVRVRGISEPPAESRFGTLYQSEPFSANSILVGQELAVTLRVHPDFFEKMTLIYPLGDLTPLGELQPRTRTLTLTGLFRSGFYEFDSKYALIPYEEGLRLFGSEARTGSEIWLESLGDLEIVKKELEKILPSDQFRIQTWRDENPKLFAALKLERIGMFLLLSVLLLIASFNIFGLTSLQVMEKIGDMAALRACGLSEKRVSRIFLTMAAGIGLFGALGGGGGGLLVTFFLMHHPIRLPTTYYLENLPLAIDFFEVIGVLLFVPLLTMVAALYPALRAKVGSPVEVLRYE